MTEGCAPDDPNELTGTPLRRRTNHSKAVRADDDDDDVSAEESDVAADDDDSETTGASPSRPTGSTSGSGPVTQAPAPTQTPAPAQTPTLKTIQQQCFEIVNKYRAMRGLPALMRWTAKEACSDQESMSDSRTGQAHGAFGSCGEMAQNECPGYPGPVQQNLPECLADMWAEGPGGGHYDNMTSTEYTMVSCGVHEVGDGSFYSVQNFR